MTEPDPAADRSPLVHIGYHKTATTWLQQSVFCRADHGFITPMQRKRIQELMVLADPLAFDAAAVRAEYDAALAATGPGEGLVPVVSEERLSGNIHSGGYDDKEIADRLRRVFPDARILIGIREQRSMILSCYKQYVVEGGPCSLKRYVNPPVRGRVKVPMFNDRHFRFDRLIGHYRELFGDDRVHVVTFEQCRADPEGFVDDICRFAGATRAGPIITAGRNVSLSGLSAGIKRRLNGPFVRDTLNPNAWVDHRLCNLIILRILQRLDRITPRAIRTWPDTRDRAYIRRWAEGRYAESNRRAAELTGLDLGGLGYDV